MREERNWNDLRELGLNCRSPGCRASPSTGGHFRRRETAPVLAAIEPDRDGKPVMPVRGIGRRDSLGGGQLSVLRVRRGSACRFLKVVRVTARRVPVPKASEGAA